MTRERTDAREEGWEAQLGPRVFSGHESFACRYGWLPKLYEAVAEDPKLFSSDERAILRLGLGRNMVKSLRFWGEAFGLTRTRNREVCVTDFAQMLLDADKGLDPYLETPGALWRLHWKLTVHGGLGAWAVMFLEMQDREIERERFVCLGAKARIAGARGNHCGHRIQPCGCVSAHLHDQHALERLARRAVGKPAPGT